MIQALLNHKGLSAVAMVAIVMAVGYLSTPNANGLFNELTEQGPIHITTVVNGLHVPWSLAFLPNGDMLVTEKYTGHLRIVSNGRLNPEPITNLPAVYPHAQAGLLEVALHPRFAENHTIYLSYSKSGDRGSTTALALAHFDGSRVTDVRDIFVADAWSNGSGQYGGKIAFDAKGMLYLTVGDRREAPERAQDPHDHAGKIVRLRDNGSLPEDNPFIINPEYRTKIYAIGMRNQYGLVIDPNSANMFEIEMGTLGGDELNRILPR